MSKAPPPNQRLTPSNFQGNTRNEHVRPSVSNGFFKDPRKVIASAESNLEPAQIETLFESAMSEAKDKSD